MKKIIIGVISILLIFNLFSCFGKINSLNKPYTIITPDSEITLVAEWEWYQKDYEIYYPCLSRGNSEIAFVRKFHWPDGHEAEFVDEKVLMSFSDRAKVEPRFADPEVVIVNLEDNSVEEIGWGWQPNFSPDGRSIVYTHQKKPISGFRTLAPCMEGNEIVIYDLNNRKQTTLVKPRKGYLGNPVFSHNGSHIAFTYEDAVNGSFGGSVGVGSINLGNKKEEVLLKPEKSFGLYHLIGPIMWLEDQVLTMRAKPTSRGMFMANSYYCSLISLTKKSRSIYSWGKRDVSELPTIFSTTSEGSLIIRNKAWLEIDPKSGKGIRKLKSYNELDRAVISPNGKFIANYDEIVLSISYLGAEKDVVWGISGTLQSVDWSRDSSRVILVTTNYKEEDEDQSQGYYAFDKITVLKIQ